MLPFCKRQIKTKRVVAIAVFITCGFSSLSFAGSPFSYFKNREVDIFPVPVFETRPDKGNSYGLMPVVLLSDEQKEIKAILAVIGQYNTVTKVSGAALAYIYPEADQEIQFYGELAQDYFREISVHYFNPHLKNRFYLEGDVSYLKTPFGHFFGLGPQRAEDDRSNYTSRNFFADATAGYYFLKKARVNWTTQFHTTDLKNRAMEQFDDTLTRYGASPSVVDSTNWLNGISLTFDSRKEREYSKKGFLANAGYFFSSKTLGSDKNFQGWQMELIHIQPLMPHRLTQVFRFQFEEIFGDGVPFYELSALGGPFELRAFTPQRFVDQGKIAFQLEERIRVLDWKLFGIPFEIYADPFFELGRVFSAVSNLGFKYWQPVGGVGFRLFVPPNVIGRVDLAVGTDGLEIYTALGYPF